VVPVRLKNKSSWNGYGRTAKDPIASISVIKFGRSVRNWHQTDMPGQADDVGSSRESGPGIAAPRACPAMTYMRGGATASRSSICQGAKAQLIDNNPLRESPCRSRRLIPTSPIFPMPEVVVRSPARLFTNPARSFEGHSFLPKFRTCRRTSAHHAHRPNFVLELASYSEAAGCRQNPTKAFRY
jgi:hypothetical protein